MKVNVKAVEDLKEGDWVNWNSDGRWYRITQDVQVPARVSHGGWAFVHMEGYPIVCSVWSTVEMPWRR